LLAVLHVFSAARRQRTSEQKCRLRVVIQSREAGSREMTMNKRYEKTDEERHQLRKLEQEEAQKQESRQQRSQDAPHRQKGGWDSEKDRGRRPDDDRNAQSGGNAGEGRTVDEP
jgi:hypothetical protein